MILKSTDDILDRFSLCGLSLFDTANRDSLDDTDIARKLKELFIIYTQELMLKQVDEFMKTTEEIRRGG